MGLSELRDGCTKSSLAVMLRSPDVSPRRLSDISPQLRQLSYLVVDECIKEELKSSRSFEDLNSACAGGLTSIEERILRITGYYGYQPWSLRCPMVSAQPSPLQTFKPTGTFLRLSLGQAVTAFL